MMRIASFLITLFFFFFCSNVDAGRTRAQQGRRRESKKSKKGGGGFSIAAAASGDQEVPPVMSETTAMIELDFDEAYTMAYYKVSIYNGVGITKVHLHCGLAGENGPLATEMFLDPEGVDVDGFFIEGTIENSDFLGNCVTTGNSVVTLANGVITNGVYLNIHSLANPPGEVRGQFFAIDIDN